jgi:hypothetical protein
LFEKQFSDKEKLLFNKEMVKDCPPNKILNQATNRCVLLSGKVGKSLLKKKMKQQQEAKKKFEQDKIKQLQAANAKAQLKKKEEQEAKKKKEEQEAKNKNCPPDKIYNKVTKRCVKKNGAIGKKILMGLVDVPEKQKYQNIPNKELHQQYYKRYTPPKINHTLLDKIINFSKTSQKFLEMEDYFYKNGPTFSPDHFYVETYFKNQNLDMSKSLEENRAVVLERIKNTKDYNFQDMVHMEVPFTRDVIMKPSKLYLGVVTVTPLYRYPLKWLLEQMNYIAQLPKIDKQVIRYYTQSGYSTMNGFLRNPKIIFGDSSVKAIIEATYKNIYGQPLQDYKNADKKLLEKTFQIVLDRFNAIIYNSPPIPEDILLFKGLKQKFDPNYKSFFSTSLHLDISNNFTNSHDNCCRIYCVAKKGSHALAVLFNSPHNEKEILFPSDVQFNLVSKDNTKIQKSIQGFKSVDVYELSDSSK